MVHQQVEVVEIDSGLMKGIKIVVAMNICDSQYINLIKFYLYNIFNEQLIII